MAVYNVSKIPLVLPAISDGGKNLTVTFENNRVSNWSNVRASVSWITVSYEDNDYEDNIHYNNFWVDAEDTYSTSTRYGYVYADYTLEDGSTGSISVRIAQLGQCDITTDAENPLIFTASKEYQESGVYKATIQMLYQGVGSPSTISSPSVPSLWECSAVASGVMGSNYGVSYDIKPYTYNVYNTPVTGTINFNFTNSIGYSRTYTQFVMQDACPYPFGLRQYVNGQYEEIPTVSSTNTLKMLTDIPFTGGTVDIRTFLPYILSVATITFEPWDEGAASFVESYDFPDGYEELICSITFTENTTTDTRLADLTVKYTTEDGKTYTDTMRLRQNASDGTNIEPEISSNTTEFKFYADGTANLYDTARIRFVGAFDDYGFYNPPEWITIGEGTVVSGAGTYNKLIEYPITVDENFSDLRQGTVTFYGVIGDMEYELNIEIIQGRYDMDDIDPSPEIPVEGDEYIGPIWKDVEYDFGSSETVNYVIYDDNDNIIFAGRSNRRPNETNNTILVNKICQNYFTIPLLKQGAYNVYGNYMTFHLKSENGNILYRTFKFINDWSYSPYFATGVLSHPILNGRSVVYGQYLPFSIFAAADSITVPMTVKYKDGAVDEFNTPLENYVTAETVKDDLVSVRFPYDGFNERGVEQYIIGDMVYDVDMDDCECPYVIYYINPWGGYDWFPVLGKCEVVDNIVQHQYVQNYNNTTWVFGNRRYLSSINRKYNITTHWLKEDESLRMWYLLESNTVYLHNIKTKEIIPVLIENDVVDHKKRLRTNPIIQYNFTLVESQTKQRI